MIVGILGPGGCGGTFLDWTIQYLSGQDQTWHICCDPLNRSNILSQLTEPLVNDPLLSNNSAHGHLKTHPNENSVDEVIEIFREHPEFTVNSFFYSDTLGNSRTQTEYNQLILTYPEVKFITYKFDASDVDAIFCFQYEKIPTHRNSIGKCSMTHSDVPLNQMPVWDQRELLSLYYPKEIYDQTLAEKLLPARNNFSFDFKTVLESLDTEIEGLFQYIGLEIKQDRLEWWKQIYNKWKIENNLDFFKDLDVIIQAILTNTPCDLVKYNMSFAREVVIASKLLYNHNLALKSYNKDNLSLNTQQWTEILEKNVYHNLTN